jgi:hypothetical protein
MLVEADDVEHVLAEVHSVNGGFAGDIAAHGRFLLQCEAEGRGKSSHLW